MLSICTATECTTIVFGRGTCVEHDEQDLREAVTGATAGSEQPEEAKTLSPVP